MSEEQGTSEPGTLGVTDCRRPRVDALTGLPWPFRDAHLHLEDAFPPAARLSPGDGLLALDINDMRYHNDYWGHIHGDTVIRTVADVVSRAAGEGPAWRSGGDEFLVMTTGGAAPALALAREIRDGVRALGEGSPGRPMDVSIGVAIAGVSDTVDTLHVRADRALNAAKHCEDRIALR